MFAAKNRLVSEVSAKLGLTEEEREAFPLLKFTHVPYIREIIYKMIGIDFRLLEKIVTFPNECRNVKEKQKVLISFLDHNENFKDVNSFYIWFNFAEEFCNNNYKKIYITHYVFQNIRSQ